jgi:hypothetical protein
MNRRLLKLIAVLFAVIIFGSTVFLSASSEKSEPNVIYNQGTVLKSINPQHFEDSVSWIEDLDKIIPPEERARITQADSETLNTTERLLQKLFSSVLEKQSFSEQDHRQLFADFIEKETRSILSEINLYQENSFNIKKNPSKNDVVAYGNTVGEIIKRNSPELEHEFIIFMNLMEKGDRQQELDLRIIAQGYKNIAEESSKVLVPEDATTVHLNFINAMKTAGFYVEKLSLLLEDPLLATIAFNRHTENEDFFINTMIDVSNYFTQKGITYQLTDDGIYYTPIRQN